MNAGLIEGHDATVWRCLTELRKWHTDDDTAYLWAPPDDLVTIEGNLLVYGGASSLWDRLSEGAPAVTAFDNGNARIGVGDSATAEAATQTNLQAATNKFRKGMDATYPLHTDGNAIGNRDIIYRASFLTGEANFVWAEWGIFNGTLETGVAAGGRMLNRKVQALGTKTSGTWQLTLTLSLA